MIWLAGVDNFTVSNVNIAERNVESMRRRIKCKMIRSRVENELNS